MKKEAVFGISRVIISIALLLLLFWLFRDNLPTVGKAIATTDPVIFALAVLCAIASNLLAAYRLKIIFASQGVRLNLRESNYLCFIGLFFNNFLPTSVGGDLVKAYYASKKSPSKAIAYAGVFVDRLMGVASLILLACAAIALVKNSSQHKIITFVVGGILIGTVMFSLLLWNRRLAKKLAFLLIFFKLLKVDQKVRKFYDAVHDFKTKKAALFNAVLLSIVLQILSFCASYLLAVSIRAHANFLNFLSFMPMVSVAAMLPSVNGLGIREGTFVYFFKQSMGAQTAFAVSLLILLQNFLLSLIGGGMYLLGQFRIKPVENEAM